MAQYPELEDYKQLFHATQYADALAILDPLISKFPQAEELRWRRGLCLEKLERYTEMPQELDRVLELNPDHIPALLKRVEYVYYYLDSMAPLPPDTDDEDRLSRKEKEARGRLIAAREQAEKELEKRNERDLRRLLAQTPDNAQACYLLSNLLRHRMQEASPVAEIQEARQLLDQAVNLDPDNIEYLSTRAQNAQGDAFAEFNPDSTGKVQDPALVRTFSGMTYKRAELESAVRDYETCLQLSGKYHYAVKLGLLLHNLGRYAEALQRYDEALAKMPADDRKRAMVIEMRARSENDGAGEREQIAQMVLGGMENKAGKDRSLQDDISAQMLLGTAEAVRRGVPVGAAIEKYISEDPDTMIAINIARRILNLTNDMPPQLAEADPKNYPAYQRKHCGKIEQEALRLGLTKVCDAEAFGMFNLLGQHILMCLFSNAGGDIGIAGFAMKHKWPGLIGFLIMLFTGKWKVQKMIECVTQYADGSLISTQIASPSPFEGGAKVITHKLPANASLAEVYRKHVEAVGQYRVEHPDAVPMQVHDLAGIEACWIAGQKTKAEYRKSIGYVSDEELRKILGKSYERFAGKVRAQIQSISAV